MTECRYSHEWVREWVEASVCVDLCGFVWIWVSEWVSEWVLIPSSPSANFLIVYGCVCVCAFLSDFFDNFHLEEGSGQQKGQVFTCKLLIRPLCVILRKAKKMHSLKIFNDINVNGEHELVFVMSCEYGMYVCIYTFVCVQYVCTGVCIYGDWSEGILTDVVYITLTKYACIILWSFLIEGIRRRHRFIYQSCDVVSAMFDDEICNHLRVMPKVIRVA
jgi:hypothetical protein